MADVNLNDSIVENYPIAISDTTGYIKRKHISASPPGTHTDCIAVQCRLIWGDLPD